MSRHYLISLGERRLEGESLARRKIKLSMYEARIADSIELLGYPMKKIDQIDGSDQWTRYYPKKGSKCTPSVKGLANSITGSAGLKEHFTPAEARRRVNDQIGRMESGRLIEALDKNARERDKFGYNSLWALSDFDDRGEPDNFNLRDLYRADGGNELNGVFGYTGSGSSREVHLLCCKEIAKRRQRRYDDGDDSSDNSFSESDIDLRTEDGCAWCAREPCKLMENILTISILSNVAAAQTKCVKICAIDVNTWIKERVLKTEVVCAGECAVLSHAWADAPLSEKRLGNGPEVWNTGLSENSLDKLCYVVSRDFGCHYLWVDQIANEGLTKEEVERLMSSLGKVYYRAAVTLVCPTGIGGNWSLARPQQRSAAGGDYVPNWFSRAWIIQEAVVSRNVFFVILESDFLAGTPQKFVHHSGKSLIPLRGCDGLRLGIGYRLKGSHVQTSPNEHLVAIEGSSFLEFCATWDSTRGCIKADIKGIGEEMRYVLATGTWNENLHGRYMSQFGHNVLHTVFKGAQSVGDLLQCVTSRQATVAADKIWSTLSLLPFPELPKVIKDISLNEATRIMLETLKPWAREEALGVIQPSFGLDKDILTSDSVENDAIRNAGSLQMKLAMPNSKKHKLYHGRIIDQGDSMASPMRLQAEWYGNGNPERLVVIIDGQNFRKENMPEIRSRARFENFGPAYMDDLETESVQRLYDYLFNLETAGYSHRNECQVLRNWQKGKDPNAGLDPHQPSHTRPLPYARLISATQSRYAVQFRGFLLKISDILLSVLRSWSCIFQWSYNGRQWLILTGALKWGFYLHGKSMVAFDGGAGEFKWGRDNMTLSGSNQRGSFCKIDETGMAHRLCLADIVTIDDAFLREVTVCLNCEDEGHVT